MMKHHTGFLRRSSVIIVAASAIAFAMYGRYSSSAAAQKADDLASFMRKKLDASSLILEGLTVNDSSLVRKGADQMLQMSKSEMWNVLTDAEYREFNQEFRSAMRKLDDAAKADNFDNALLQWFDGVKGCVECHKYVRDQRPKLKK